MSASKRILIVDDIPEIVRYVRSAVERIRLYPIDVRATTDAVEALHLVGEESFDVVVSDYRMPGVDGLQILARARATNPRGHRVLITGYNEIPASRDAFSSAGLSASVAKPIPMSALVDLLADCLASAN